MATDLIAIGTLIAAIGAIGTYHAEAVARYGGWRMATNFWLGPASYSTDHEPSRWQVTYHRVTMGLLTLLGVAVAVLGVVLLLGVE